METEKEYLVESVPNSVKAPLIAIQLTQFIVCACLMVSVFSDPGDEYAQIGISVYSWMAFAVSVMSGCYVLYVRKKY